MPITSDHSVPYSSDSSSWILFAGSLETNSWASTGPDTSEAATVVAVTGATSIAKKLIDAMVAIITDQLKENLAD
jgi:hypothetical protein